MGKVKAMLQEFEELNGPLEEPTDEELQVLAQQQRAKPLSARSPYGF